MTESEIVFLVQRQIKSLSSNFDSGDYADAVAEAKRETGFSLPTSTTFQIFWLIQRIKRALLFTLLTENVESFKVKQINLQQKFDNLSKLVEYMDKEFIRIQKEEPHEFAQVSVTQLFGHKVDAGFSYEEDTGRETTYQEDQLLFISPVDTD